MWSNLQNFTEFAQCHEEKAEERNQIIVKFVTEATQVSDSVWVFAFVPPVSSCVISNNGLFVNLHL